MHRNEVIIFAACIVFVLVGAYLLFQPVHAPAPALEQAVTTQAVPFTVLGTGDAATTTKRKNVRFTNQEELASVWTALYGKKSSAPKIDFSHNEVYVVYDGTHPTTGFAVSVEKIVETGDTRTVSILHAAPDASCSLKKATMNPFQVVVVPVSSGTLTHTDTTARVSCK